jgi:hypothetical protein
MTQLQILVRISWWRSVSSKEVWKFLVNSQDIAKSIRKGPGGNASPVYDVELN